MMQISLRLKSGYDDQFSLSSKFYKLFINEGSDNLVFQHEFMYLFKYSSL